MAEIKNQSAASDQQFADALKKAYREWKTLADRSANANKRERERVGRSVGR